MKTQGLVAFCVVALVAVALTGCGGGGGGGGGSNAVVIEIVVQGIAAPLFTNGQAPQPACPAGAALNSRITIRFGGGVDVTSLPADGPATGSIGITANSGNQATAASGTWLIDAVDPSVVHFFPFPPADPNQGCIAGLQGATTYVINIPDGSAGTDTVKVGGTPIQTAVNVCFQTAPCPSQNPPSFIDAVPGPPLVVGTTPTMASNAPQTTVGAIAGPTPGTSQIIIDISEPLEPTTVTNNTIQLLNTSSNALVNIQMASVTAFQQTGTIPGVVGQTSRIILTTSQSLPDGDTFEVQFLGVADLGGNALTVPVGGELRFSLMDNNDDVDGIVTENFNTAVNVGTVSGAVQWIGNGMVEATFPQEIVGDGSDGNMTFNSNMNINTSPGSGFGDLGEFNFTALTVSAGVTLTFTSTTNDPMNLESVNAAQVRSQTSINLNDGATLACNGATGQPGQPNGGATPELGGAGGPGGGRGGQSSPIVGGDSLTGEAGFGGRTDPVNANCPGNMENANPASTLFGGGGAGTGGPPGPTGPSGGGGGSASAMFPGTAGESQAGTNGMGLGAPPGGSAGPIPPAMTPPLMCVMTGASFPMGGSGGGGAGDRIDTVGNPGLADTGGAGGGGGGALRVSAGGAITFGLTVQLQANGGNGGSAAGFLVARGGGGSGGSIMVQTFTDLDLGLGGTVVCSGGLPGGVNPSPALDGDGGIGGSGVIQLEDSDGTFPGFGLAFFVGEVFSQQFAFANDVVGTATSRRFDTNSASTDYLQSNSLGTTMATLNPGTTGTITLQVIGFAEDPNNPGNPGTTPNLMMGPVDLANVADLNGFRYFRFVIDTSFPPPPATALGDPLPNATFFQLCFAN